MRWQPRHAFPHGVMRRKAVRCPRQPQIPRARDDVENDVFQISRAGQTVEGPRLISLRLTSASFAAMVLLSLSSAASSSVSGPVFEVVCEGPLPFSRSELEAALRPRSRLLSQPVSSASSASDPVVRRVFVRALRDGVVGIEVGSGRREIQLQGQTGEAAARVVALLAVETPVEVTAPSIVRRPPVASRGWQAMTLGAQMVVPFVANGWTATAEPTVMVGIPVTSRTSIALGVGYSSLWADGDAMALQLRQVPVRGGLAYAAAPWMEVHFSGVARTYAVSGGADTDMGIHWGITASATAYRQLSERVAFVVSAGLDAIRSRTEFRVDERPQLTTNWLVPWVGAGLAVRIMRR